MCAKKTQLTADGDAGGDRVGGRAEGAAADSVLADGDRAGDDGLEGSNPCNVNIVYQPIIGAQVGLRF